MNNDDKRQRGIECAMFISNFMDQLGREMNLARCEWWTIQRWDEILLARGVESHVRLFWEPGHIGEVKSPFESIDPIYEPLKRLQKTLNDPDFDVQAIRDKIDHIMDIICDDR